MRKLINLNHASPEEIAALPGLGIEIANRIVKQRQVAGPFKSLNELKAIRGITSRILSKIRGQAGLGDKPPGDDPSSSVAIEVILRNKKEGATFTGHVLIVGYTYAEQEPRNGGEEISIPKREIIELPASGSTLVFLPAQLREQVIFRVQAPDGRALLVTKIPAATLPSKIELSVEPRSYAAPSRNENPSFGRPLRLRGKIIDARGGEPVTNRLVVIWAAEKENPAPSDFYPVLATKSDEAGYFTGPYPAGAFSDANATISLKGRNATVPVRLENGEFPASVILVLELEPADIDANGATAHGSCGCKTLYVPRDPDTLDLARGDGTFSSDPGAGQCVDFTKPDRTLEEFSFSYAVRTTEPEIQGLVLDEPPRVDLGQIIPLFPGEFRRRFESVVAAAGEAKPLAIDAQILKTLLADPEGATPARFALAAEQTARNEALRIVAKRTPPKSGRAPVSVRNPVDWDEDPTVFQACTIAHGHLLRFKQEWVADGYSMGNLLYSLPLAPGQKKQIAIVDWERRESSSRTEELAQSEALQATLSRDRDISEIVNSTVNESVQGGSTAETQSEAFGAAVGIIGTGVGGLFGVAGGEASASSEAWQESSRRAAANALNQLRDRTIQSASAVRSQRSTVVQTVTQGERVVATTEVIANYNHCHALTVQYFEVLRHLLVRQRLVDVQECLFVPLLMSQFTRDKALRWRNTLRGVSPASLRQGFDALERIDRGYVGSDLPAGAYADASLEYIDGELSIRFILARPADDENGFDSSQWEWMKLLLPDINAREFYKTYLEDRTPKDRLFQDQLGARIAEAIVQRLQFYAIRNDETATRLRLDATLAASYVHDRPLAISLRPAGTLDPLTRKEIKAIQIKGLLANLLPLHSRLIVESGSIRYRTRFASGYLFRETRLRDDLAANDDVRVSTPLTQQELRNPREEDKELSRRLLDHLNENLERYHHAIWSRMSRERRYMLLDGFEAPNSGGRSVASVVENELVGMVGNCLVLPVARGIHLDPTYRQDAKKPFDLFEHYQPNTPIEPMRIAIPTKGVYAEAVLGACNSCERKEEDRFWRWEESPLPDSPAAILPVSTDSRRSEPPDLTAKDFPTPIVNLQNAPAAPDPTGLASLLQVLGSQNLFRDLSGLEGNQRNAAAALQGAFSSLQALTDKAAELALQSRMAKDIDKMRRVIQEAKDAGQIDDQQAKALTERAIGGAIGTGAVPASAEPVTVTEFKEVIAAAGAEDAAASFNPGTGQLQVDARPLPGVNPPGTPPTAAPGTPQPELLAGRDAEPRSFNQAINDLSGETTLSVGLATIPPSAKFTWTEPGGPLHVKLIPVSDLAVKVLALTPGPATVTFEVKEPKKAAVTLLSVPLSIPQFVLVNEDKAKFEAFLTTFQLLSEKEKILAEAREMTRFIYRNTNIRFVWEPIGQRLPEHLRPENQAELPAKLRGKLVTNVTIAGDPPSVLPNTQAAEIDLSAGPASKIFNEAISIFPGAFGNAPAASSSPTAGAQAHSLFRDILETLKTPATLPSGISIGAYRDFAAVLVGRRLGVLIVSIMGSAIMRDEIDSVDPTIRDARDLTLLNDAKLTVNGIFENNTGFKRKVERPAGDPPRPSDFEDFGTEVGPKPGPENPKKDPFINDGVGSFNRGFATILARLLPVPKNSADQTNLSTFE